MKTFLNSLLLTSILFLLVACEKQKIRKTQDQLNGDWIAMQWRKYRIGETVEFLNLSDAFNNAPGIHIGTVYGSTNGIFINDNEFSYFLLRDNEKNKVGAVHALEVYPDELRINQTNEAGGSETYLLEIVELSETTLWIKFQREEPSATFIMEYKYEKL